MIDWENDIKRYHRGEMTPEEEHAFEKRALQDPFLAEALEGSSLVSSQEFSDDLADIHKRLQQKIKKKIWLWPLRIAASVALIILSYFAITRLFERDLNQDLALQKQEIPEGKQQLTESIDESVQQQSEKNKPTIDQQSSDRGKQKSALTNERDEINKKDITSLQPVGNPSLNEGPIKDSISRKELTLALIESEKVAIAEEKILKSKTETQQFSLNEKKALMQSNPNRLVVQGKVLSAEDYTPIPGVNVVIKGTNQGTVTDMNGNYKLITAGDAKLIYSFIGLQTQEVDAKDQSEINVNLQTDASQLSEVVVTGYSPYTNDEAREPVIKLAEPAGGKKAYDKYLKTGLVYPRQALENKVKGRVTISFTVKTNGSLDEFSVVKGLGYGCEQEVIRLVKEGPKWSPTTEDSVPVESEVRVRVKFALPD